MRIWLDTDIGSDADDALALGGGDHLAAALATLCDPARVRANLVGQLLGAA